MAELEDRNAREGERRRDYRMQIDDYHRILGEERLDLSKKQKALLNREAIIAEQQIVMRIGEEERRRKFAGMQQYNIDLANQINSKSRQFTRDDIVDDNEYHKHTGLNIGDYREPSKEELIRVLKIQVDNKNKR